MDRLDEVKKVLGEVLGLGDRVRFFTVDTPLFGSLPEMDSLAVIHVIAGLEQQFGIVVEDDDVSVEVFETVGALVALVDRKSK